MVPVERMLRIPQQLKIYAQVVLASWGCDEDE
jgi:hypothetical protein